MSEDTVAPFAFWSDETAQRSKFCWKNSGADTAARAFSQAVLQSGEDAKEREAQERRNAFRALSRLFHGLAACQNQSGQCGQRGNLGQSAHHSLLLNRLFCVQARTYLGLLSYNTFH